MRRRGLIAGMIAIAGAAFMVAPVLAQKSAIYTGETEGIGAGGYDVVAYQIEKRAIEGDAGITASHDGVIWRFANVANRDAFKADPDRYTPQYGGYCAWAVANGYTAHGDPEAWNVVDGRLYLNYSRSIRSRWERDVPGNITKANANWPRVLE